MRRVGLSLAQAPFSSGIAPSPAKVPMMKNKRMDAEKSGFQMGLLTEAKKSERINRSEFRTFLTALPLISSSKFRTTCVQSPQHRRSGCSQAAISSWADPTPTCRAMQPVGMESEPGNIGEDRNPDSLDLGFRAGLPRRCVELRSRRSPAEGAGREKTLGGLLRPSFAFSVV